MGIWPGGMACGCGWGVVVGRGGRGAVAFEEDLAFWRGEAVVGRVGVGVVWACAVRLARRRARGRRREGRWDAGVWGSGI